MHCTCGYVCRNTCGILVGKLLWKRPLIRPKGRRKDNSEATLKEYVVWL
jgi:hypothetical protein